VRRIGRKHIDKFRGKMKWAQRRWLKRLERKKRKKEAQQR